MSGTSIKISVGELKGRFPEFCDAPDTLVAKVLEEACRRTNETVWGDRFQDGVLYLAAHLLAINPQSRNMAKCCDDKGGTTYLRERHKLNCVIASGFRVTGSGC